MCDMPPSHAIVKGTAGPPSTIHTPMLAANTRALPGSCLGPAAAGSAQKHYCSVNSWGHSETCKDRMEIAQTAACRSATPRYTQVPNTGSQHWLQMQHQAAHSAR
jgi:hypothetical protein